MFGIKTKSGTVGRPAKPGETPNRRAIPVTKPKGKPVKSKPPTPKTGS